LGNGRSAGGGFLSANIAVMVEGKPFALARLHVGASKVGRKENAGGGKKIIRRKQTMVAFYRDDCELVKVPRKRELLTCEDGTRERGDVYEDPALV